MNSLVRLRFSALILIGCTALPQLANAQVRPTLLPAQSRITPAVVPIRQLPAQGNQPNSLIRPSSSASKAVPNAIYGIIAAMNGNTLIIRTRSGRLRTVDASPAITAGTFSAPLFVGKPVVAEGLTRVNGVLTAVRVSRLTRLDHSAADH